MSIDKRKEYFHILKRKSMESNKEGSDGHRVMVFCRMFLSTYSEEDRICPITLNVETVTHTIAHKYGHPVDVDDVQNLTCKFPQAFEIDSGMLIVNWQEAESLDVWQ